MKNIFVGNLNFGATEAAVRSLFETYGSVERVNSLLIARPAKPRGSDLSRWALTRMRIAPSLN